MFKAERMTIFAVAVLVVCVCGLVWFGVAQWRAAQNAGTEVRVSEGQAGAATASGQDAVNTVGNSAAFEAASDTMTGENNGTIRKADGADAPVAAGVRNAGISALCRRVAYQNDPTCRRP